MSAVRCAVREPEGGGASKEAFASLNKKSARRWLRQRFHSLISGRRSRRRLILRDGRAHVYFIPFRNLFKPKGIRFGLELSF